MCAFGQRQGNEQIWQMLFSTGESRQRAQACSLYYFKLSADLKSKFKARKTLKSPREMGGSSRRGCSCLRRPRGSPRLGERLGSPDTDGPSSALAQERFWNARHSPSQHLLPRSCHLPLHSDMAHSVPGVSCPDEAPSVKLLEALKSNPLDIIQNSPTTRRARPPYPAVHTTAAGKASTQKTVVRLGRRVWGCILLFVA